MVYHNKVVATVKVAGKVLREDGNLVTLPFGAEYSVYIKNLNSLRIKAKISIDGKDVADGQTYIIDANSELNLERYMIHGNYNSGNRFKFIEKTEALEERRWSKAEDGLIRIEYWTEKKYEPVQWQYPSYPPYQSYMMNMGSNQNVFFKSARIGNDREEGEQIRGRVRASNTTTQDFGGDATYTNTCITRGLNTTNMMNCAVNQIQEASGSDRGITVPGSQSNQAFIRGSYFPVESQSEVIVLQLRGEIAGQPVLRPMTVDTKRYCQTCGKRSIGWKQYCGDCGTALVII